MRDYSQEGKKQKVHHFFKRELRLNIYYLARQVQGLGMNTSSNSIPPCYLIFIMVPIKFLSRSAKAILNSVWL